MQEREVRGSLEVKPKRHLDFYYIPVSRDDWKQAVQIFNANHVNDLIHQNPRDFNRFTNHLDHAIGLALLGHPVSLQIPSYPSYLNVSEVLYMLSWLTVSDTVNLGMDVKSLHLQLQSTVQSRVLIIDTTHMSDWDAARYNQFNAGEDVAIIKIVKDTVPFAPESVVLKVSERKVHGKADPKKFPPEVLIIALSTNKEQYPNIRSRLLEMIQTAVHINPNEPIWLEDYSQALGISPEKCMSLI